MRPQMVPDNKNTGANNLPDEEGVVDTRDTADHIRRLQAKAESIVQNMMSKHTALHDGDKAGFLQSVSTGDMQKFYKTDEEKIRYLESIINEHLPKTERQLQAAEQLFHKKLQDAKSKKYISDQSAQRWKDRLNDSNVAWYQKYTFLTKDFPNYYARWEKVGSDWKGVTEQATKAGIKKEDMKALADILGSSYHDKPFEEKRQLTETAVAAVNAKIKGREELLGLAERELKRAVDKKGLAPNKVSTWMSRIFKSNASNDNIEKFLKGSGAKPLNELVNSWVEASRQFQEIDNRKKKGEQAPHFQFVNMDKFLQWHYETRMAYIREANAQLKPVSDPKEFRDIRREMGAKDWDSALDLIGSAFALDLTDEQFSELGGMKSYAASQKSADTPLQIPEKDDDTNEFEKVDDMYLALAELGAISPAIYTLYVKAIACGATCFDGVRSLMYNRCWVHENSVLDEGDEVHLQEAAKEDTEKILRDGHGRTFENNDPSFGSGAIRPHKTGEWSPQVLHLGADGSGADAIVSACNANGNNFNFKYWTTLIPAGLDIGSHKHIVYNLNYRIKNALRSSKGSGAHSVNWSDFANRKAKKGSNAAKSLA